MLRCREMASILRDMSQYEHEMSRMQPGSRSLAQERAILAFGIGVFTAAMVMLLIVVLNAA